jgi:diguanylate cyclase (GGDEF)-like protein/PAS domain S-box-containing protein
MSVAIPIASTSSSARPSKPDSSRSLSRRDILLGLLPFVAILVLLVLLGSARADMLSAVRAYVSGESLWSKAQKQAVSSLHRYAQIRTQASYEEFRRLLAVPLGDRLAREELEKAAPDEAVVRRGFLAGQNYADDIPGMMRLFRRFRNLPEFANAIALWAEGDRQISALMQTAEQLHTQVASDRGVTVESRTLQRIDEIDADLTRLERNFSATLGGVSRQLERELNLAMLAASLFLAALAWVVASRMSRKVDMAQNALRTSETQRRTDLERALVTLESIGEGVISTDATGRIEYINPIAAALTGWNDFEAAGQPLAQIYRWRKEPGETAADPVEQVLREPHHVKVSTQRRLLSRDGEEIAVEESAAPIRGVTGEVSGVVLVLHDIRREREYVTQLTYLNTHDPLTGLLNRREFEHRVRLLLQNAAASNRRHAMLYVDLDQFKVVNDACGHAGGDELLRQIGPLLQGCVRAGDSVARLGGDEFGLLLENCDSESAERIANKLCQTMYDFHFLVSERSFWTSASIGVVNLADAPFTFADVMNAADEACALAKEKGRNRVQCFIASDRDLSDRKDQMTWVSRIRAALEAGRLRLYSQEIRPLGDSGLRGPRAELLLRMLDESGEIILPMAFIPAAERYGLMTAIDRWVIRTALQELAQLARRSDDSGGLFTINMSGMSIGDDSFLDFVKEQFAQFSLAPGTICFEITETVAIANLTKATRFMHQLRTLGCQFALDDFGAGMSSFGYLHHLPVDFVKIDGSFVKNMMNDPVAHAIVETIHRISHLMGKRTIAESVEDDSMLIRLREMGVDYVQGYAIGRPRPFHHADHDARSMRLSRTRSIAATRVVDSLG